MTYRREKTQNLQIQKYFFPKMSLNQPLIEYFTRTILDKHILDKHNHYVTVFGKIYKEKLGEALIAS